MLGSTTFRISARNLWPRLIKQALVEFSCEEFQRWQAILRPRTTLDVFAPAPHSTAEAFARHGPGAHGMLETQGDTTTNVPVPDTEIRRNVSNLHLATHLPEIRRKGSFESAKRLKIVGQGGRWPLAFELLAALQNEALECGRFQYGPVLSTAAKASTWTKSLFLLQTGDVAAYTATILALEKSSHWSIGLEQWQEMAMHRTAVDLKAWTAATKSAGPWEKALAMAAAMASPGVEPDAAYSVVLLSALGNWKVLLAKLQADGQRGLDVRNPRTLSSVACGEWRRSLDLGVLDAEASPNIIVYNAMASRSDWVVALKVLALAKDRQLRCDAVGYCSAMSVSTSSGRWPVALWLFSQFWEAPDEALMDAALQAASRDWQQALAALAFFGHIRHLPLSGKVRTAASLAAQAAAEAQQWEVAMQIGSAFGSFGSFSSSSLATAFGAKLLWSHSLLLAEGLVQGNFDGADVFAKVMTTLERCSRWQREQHLFQDLLRWRCELDNVCYNCAIGSCNEHQWPAALELAFGPSGPSPDRKHDLVQTTQLVTLLGESGLWNLALLAAADVQRVEPDVILSSSSSSACERSSHWKLALSIQQSDRTRLRADMHLKTYPGYYHIVSTAALLAMAGHEVCGLIATYLGSQQTQALIPHLKSRCLPSFLLALMFGVLACAERLFSRADWTIAHVQPNADGLTAPGRPVYTMQYFEWGINVPILFILSGYCSLGRPLHEVSRPLIVTNIYVIFCWAAAASTSGLLKWMFVFVAFALFGWASADMLAWVDKFEHSAPQDLPSRNIRPWLSNGLIIDFLLYGVVYMSSMLGLIDAHTERKGFFVLTFGSKIAYCAAFVFIRADEYHKTLTDVLRKVSVSNVGMISILRGSFDIILPCVLDAAGRCKLPPQMSGDMEKLEKMLGCRVAGANLKDLLAGEDTLPSWQDNFFRSFQKVFQNVKT
eukprot:s1049_g27.t1